VGVVNSPELPGWRGSGGAAHDSPQPMGVTPHDPRPRRPAMLFRHRGSRAKTRQAGQGRPQAARRGSLDEPGSGHHGLWEPEGVPWVAES